MVGVAPKPQVGNRTFNATLLSQTYLIDRSPATISKDTSRRPETLPPFFRLGRTALWLESDVIAWLKEKSKGAQAKQRATIQQEQVQVKVDDASPPKRGPGRPRKNGGRAK